MARSVARPACGVIRSAVDAATGSPPDYAVIDLRLPGGSGLMLMKRLRELSQTVRMVVLTGFGSIPTTVDAINLGACR